MILFSEMGRECDLGILKNVIPTENQADFFNELLSCVLQRHVTTLPEMLFFDIIDYVLQTQTNQNLEGKLMSNDSLIELISLIDVYNLTDDGVRNYLFGCCIECYSFP